MIKKIAFFLGILTSLSSCRVFNSSIMFKTPRNYNFATPPPVSQSTLYRIAPNGLIDFRLFSNDGFKLVDITSVGGNAMNNPIENIVYKVDQDGTVKLPVLGRVVLQGLTLREAEILLEEKYAKYYIKPFVMLQVKNKRVMVFPGSAGAGMIVPLNNENMTLIEALAQAGGIANRGKARKVKLIRGDLKNPEVFLIDLSTISGIKSAELVLQNNDIIYVEPRNELFKGIATELAPIASIMISVVTLYAIIARVGN